MTTYIALGDQYDGDFGDDVVWCVYDYTSGSYDGYGSAYYKTVDNQYYSMTLGHCSCFGPWDNSPNQITKDEMYNLELCGNDPSSVAIKNAIMKLEGDIAT